MAKGIRSNIGMVPASRWARPNVLRGHCRTAGPNGHSNVPESFSLAIPSSSIGGGKPAAPSPKCHKTQRTGRGSSCLRKEDHG